MSKGANLPAAENPTGGGPQEGRVWIASPKAHFSRRALPYWPAQTPETLNTRPPCPASPLLTSPDG